MTFKMMDAPRPPHAPAPQLDIEIRRDEEAPGGGVGPHTYVRRGSEAAAQVSAHSIKPIMVSIMVSRISTSFYPPTYPPTL